MQRRRMIGLMSAAALSILLSGRFALAAREPAGDAAVLGGLVRTHALPRFDALASAAGIYAERLAQFAAAPTADGLESCRAAHRAVYDAWAGVQHLRAGPLSMELRADRIAFWPERAGVVQRQILAMLKARDPKLLEPGGLARQSAAVQGLTALERLLFDEGVTAASFQGDEAGRFRGALAAAVAQNVLAITREVRDGWKALEAPLTAGEQTALGPDAGSAVNVLFTGALTALQVVADQKLLAPLGPNAGEAKPAVAEALRSGQSARNVRINLEALRALLLGEGGGPGLTALLPAGDAGAQARRALEEGFTAAIRAAEAIPAPINIAVADPAKRKTVEATLQRAKDLRNLLTGTVAPLLDISIGFNELDGD
ncbi:imelysin family protein [Azospirillum argentinense]|uniref:imelysin family protein n=1 Tax=Azospirillum argentinense TaxID=2970906 RepID=UPI001FFEB0E1|nr:imelysin family protein [Azospirillum argentinense]